MPRVLFCLEMCPVLVCLTDVESESENVNSQSMCLSVRSEQLVQLGTQFFFAVADNTQLAGERKIAKLDRIAVINEREKQTGRPLHGVWRAWRKRLEGTHRGGKPTRSE